MSLKDQPAFPCAKETIDGPQRTVERFTGMTLRHYYVGLAMQGMIAGSQGLQINSEQFATQSLKLADALLAELEKPAQKGEGT